MTVPKSTCCGNKGNFTAPVINFRGKKSAPEKLSPENLVSKPPISEVTRYKRRFSVKSDHGPENRKLDHESRRLAKSHQIIQNNKYSSNTSITNNKPDTNVCPTLARQAAVSSLLKKHSNVQNGVSGSRNMLQRARSAPNECQQQQQTSNYYYSSSNYGSNCQINYFVIKN